MTCSYGARFLSAGIAVILQIGALAQPAQVQSPPGSAFQLGPDGKSVMVRCGSPPTLDSFQIDLATVTPAVKPLGAAA